MTLIEKIQDLIESLHSENDSFLISALKYKIDSDIKAEQSAKKRTFNDYVFSNRDMGHVKGFIESTAKSISEDLIPKSPTEIKCERILDNNYCGDCDYAIIIHAYKRNDLNPESPVCISCDKRKTRICGILDKIESDRKNACNKAMYEFSFREDYIQLKLMINKVNYKLNKIKYETSKH